MWFAEEARVLFCLLSSLSPSLTYITVVFHKVLHVSMISWRGECSPGPRNHLVADMMWWICSAKKRRQKKTVCTNSTHCTTWHKEQCGCANPDPLLSSFPSPLPTVPLRAVRRVPLWQPGGLRALCYSPAAPLRVTLRAMAEAPQSPACAPGDADTAPPDTRLGPLGAAHRRRGRGAGRWSGRGCAGCAPRKARRRHGRQVAVGASESALPAAAARPRSCSAACAAQEGTANPRPLRQGGPGAALPPQNQHIRRCRAWPRGVRSPVVAVGWGVQLRV